MEMKVRSEGLSKMAAPHMETEVNYKPGEGFSEVRTGAPVVILPNDTTDEELEEYRKGLPTHQIFRDGKEINLQGQSTIVDPNASAPAMRCTHCGTVVAGRKNRRVHQDNCRKQREHKQALLKNFLRENPEIAKKIVENSRKKVV